MALSITLNGQSREFPELADRVTLNDLVSSLDLKGDRIAIEHNGEIVARASWATNQVEMGDRIEVVHFVGGGTVSLNL